MLGITSYGAYIPYYRLPRSVINSAWGRPGGSGEIAVANNDEDSITMAVAAGLDCLKGINPKSIDGLFFGTTSAPYRERLNATIVSTGLDFRDDVRNADFANCLRGGTLAMLSAVDAVKAASMKSVLIAAADMRLGAASGDNEMNLGNGAAALLLGTENVIAIIEGACTLSEDFPDSYRASGDTYVRSTEDRWGLDNSYMQFPVGAASRVLKMCNLAPKDVTKVCLYGTNTRKQADLAKKMGFKPEQVQESLLDTAGNTGTALSLMILVGALEQAKAGDRILLVSHGNGSDAIVLKVTENIEKLAPRRGIKGHLNIKRLLDRYEKLLRWRETLPLESQARPEKEPISPPSLWRDRLGAMALYGGKCKKCGTPQMFLDTVSAHPRVCLECFTKDQFEPYRFADKRGKVVTFSHDYLAISQDPPNTLTVVDFAGGGRGQFEMTDRDPKECQVGMDVEMTFRKLFTSNRGLHNYFWKCKPARD